MQKGWYNWLLGVCIGVFVLEIHYWNDYRIKESLKVGLALCV